MRRIEVDVAIIGAGTAGLAAYRAASETTSRLVLIEGGEYGTTCARVGCMPSKLLIAAAEANHAVAHAPLFGIHPPGPARVDGREVMARVRRERDRFVGFVLEAVDGFPAETRLRGHARFLDDHRLEVGDGTIVEAGRVVIATGSSPSRPPMLAEAGELLATSDDIFYWDDLPESAAVFGAGVIGLEIGQALHRLGVRMRLFGKGGAIAQISDPALRDYAAVAFAAELPFMPDAELRSVRQIDGQVELRFVEDGREKCERFAVLVAATGRRPNLAGLDLDRTTAELDPRGVPVFDRTTGQIGDSSLFIAGDADAGIPLLHEAADGGRAAGYNAAGFPELRAYPRRTPLAIVFCEPQIATVGERFAALSEAGLDFAIGEVSYEDQGRARVIGQNKGLLRLYGEHGTGRLLGAELMAPQGEHLAHLIAWSIQAGLTVEAMLAMPFYHPVVEEGLRSALRDLRRALRMGPVPLPRCLDCGPGG